MKKIARSGHKSEDISESVNSFHSGAIFLPSLGHKLSRNAFVVSILFSERISLIRTDLTRRAFSALRVIRVKGELTSRMVQDFLG